MAIQHLRRFRLRVRIDKTRAENAKRRTQSLKQTRKSLDERLSAD